MSEQVKIYSVRGQFDPGLDLMTTRKVVLATDYNTLHAEAEALRVALSGMLFAFDDGVGQEWSKPLLDHARTLRPAKEYKP